MRYLSSLEETTGDTGFNGCCFVGCLPIASSVLWGIFAGFSLAVWLVIVTTIGLSILLAYLSSGTVNTTPERISYKQPFRSQSIAWTDINNALTVTERKSRWTVISTTVTTIRLPLPIDGRVDASIWQHLYKHGKADNYTPSDDTLSIWADIPDDIPQEMDYYHEEVREVCPATKYQLRENYISEEMLDIAREDLRRMNRANNPSVIQWSDVKDVRWDSEHDHDFSSLMVESKSGETIYITDWTQGSADQAEIENTRFLLAVIRRARRIESQPAIVIPKHIREACGIQLVRP